MDAPARREGDREGGGDVQGEVRRLGRALSRLSAGVGSESGAGEAEGEAEAEGSDTASSHEGTSGRADERHRHQGSTFDALAALVPSHHLRRTVSPSTSEPLEVLRALNMVVAALQETGSAFTDAKNWRNKYERIAERHAELERELGAYKAHARRQREEERRDGERERPGAGATPAAPPSGPSTIAPSRGSVSGTRGAIMAAVADRDGGAEVRFDGVSVGEAAAAFVAANDAHAWASHVEDEAHRSHGGCPAPAPGGRPSSSFTLHRSGGAGGAAPAAEGPPPPHGRLPRVPSDRRLSIPEFGALSSSSLKLRWLTRPRAVLIIVKPDVPAVQSMLRQALLVLTGREGMTVYLEPDEHARLLAEKADLPLETPSARQSPVSSPTASPRSSPLRCGSVRTWVTDVNSVRPTFDVMKELDLVVTFGGDGTVLWASILLGRGPVPPVLSFSMGSMGFLAPFTADRWDAHLDDVLDGDFALMLRHRLHCRIERGLRGGEEEPGDLRGSPPMEDIIVMNEVVIDRGMSPFLTNIECYCDGVFVTAVQGDGIIISTPTGSTAYSVAAGGSMVHPQVPGILFTPICPHSLSFRPLVFPDTVTLSVQMQEGSRNANCWCSFDGKERMQLSEGDRLVISLARAPMPIVCSKNATEDWFGGIREGLFWNQRRTQGAPGDGKP